MKDVIDQAIEDAGITMHTVFVPFSQSRNKDERMPSLNFKVTIKVHGYDVLTTDYSMGCGHCKSYVQGARTTVDQHNKLMRECETGMNGLDRNRVVPKRRDVLYSLVMDSDVIEYSCFEEWADNCGMDTDSRKAESMYKQCLETALKFVNSMPRIRFENLKESYVDY